MMRNLLIAALLLLGSSAASASDIVKVYAGANGVWYDNSARPSDFEAGGSARASLSPHIAAVGEAFYGFDHSYLVGAVGARVTATDVDNPNFSIGLGILYQASSEPAIRAEEWCPDVKLGWKPWPQDLPRWIVNGEGRYGLRTNQAFVLLGVRYELGGFGQ